MQPLGTGTLALRRASTSAAAATADAGNPETCPVEVRRRIQAWFGIRPGAAVPRLLAGVLESGRSVSPALRGVSMSPRTLRFAGGGAVVDLQVRPSSSNGLVLHVAVNPACPGATVEVRVPRRGAPLRTVLDGDGTGDVLLPSGTRRVNVTVRIVGSEGFRLPPLQLN